MKPADIEAALWDVLATIPEGEQWSTAEVVRQLWDAFPNIESSAALYPLVYRLGQSIPGICQRAPPELGIAGPLKGKLFRRMVWVRLTRGQTKVVLTNADRYTKPLSISQRVKRLEDEVFKF